MSDNTAEEAALAEASLLIRSGYPYLYVLSYEEDRLAKAVQRLGAQLEREVFIWSPRHGLYPAAKSPKRLSASRTFLEGIDDIERFSGPGLFVMLDAHHGLESVDACRALRDLVYELPDKQKTIVFVGTSEKIPDDLRKDISVIVWPLPNVSELQGLVDDHCPKGLSAEHREVLARSARGLTLREALRAFRKASVDDHSLDLDDVDRVLAEKRRLIRQSGALDYFEPDASLAEVGGLGALKAWVRSRGRAFSDDARRFGLPAPKGILLAGVQGCGKSLACQTIAAEWRMPLVRLDLGAIFGSYVGMSEANIRTALVTAESVAPCVLWIDEIEKGLAGLGSSDVSDAGTTSRVFSSVLTWLQEKDAPVFVAATANRISGLPPELLRRGRFDEIFFVDLPSSAERTEILAIHLSKHGRSPDGFDLDAHARASHGHTGSELEQIVINGLFHAFEGSCPLNDEHLARGIEHTIPLSTSMAEEIERLQRWGRDRALNASTPAAS